MSDLKVLATGLMFPEGPIWQDDGSVLLVEIERETLTRVTPNGKVEVVAKLPGGPNGAAMGPDGAVYVCNNGGFLFNKVSGLNRTRPGVKDGYTGGWIERVNLSTGKSERVYENCDGQNFLGPNDIQFDHQGGFYFTDFGKSYPRHRDLGGVFYGRADGSKVVAITPPMVAPNGVGISPDDKVVYAAETETGRLWAFDMEAPGKVNKKPFPSPHGGRLVIGLGGFQRFDSMAIEANGNICVATLMAGCISVIAPDGTLVEQPKMPDPITTNICFGGKDMKTAYITLSGTGQLVTMPWARPGLRLPYN